MEQAEQCTHGEAHVHGVDAAGNLYSVRVDVHSCDYVDGRNSLIPFAEAKANRAVGYQTPKGTEEERAVWNGRWNQAFLGEMDRMWALRCESLRAMRHPQQHLVAA